MVAKYVWSILSRKKYKGKLKIMLSRQCSAISDHSEVSYSLGFKGSHRDLSPNYFDNQEAQQFRVLLAYL